MANICYCRFCGAQISYVRSASAAVTPSTWKEFPVDWPTTPAPSVGTIYSPGSGVIPHFVTCPFRLKWIRRAGHVKGIVTRPDLIGSI